MRLVIIFKYSIKTLNTWNIIEWYTRDWLYVHVYAKVDILLCTHINYDVPANVCPGMLYA